MTDNEATRTTFVRTRTALDEAACYEAEAENFGLEVTLAMEERVERGRKRRERKRREGKGLSPQKNFWLCY